MATLEVNARALPEVFPKFQVSSAPTPTHGSLLQEVREVGCFSLDEHRAFHDDNRSLSEYAPPSLGCSLSDGYPDRFVEFPEDQQKTEHLDSLLRWLNVHAQDKGFEFPDFICWRGLFTKVMCAPFSPSNELRISIVKHKGVFYMVEFETENEKKKRDMRSEKDKLMCYWGHRFEGFATRARHDPAQRPSPHAPEPSASAHVTNTNVAFCTVVRTKLEKHTLLMGAEIDCIGSNGAYIELKTSQTISHPRQKNSFLRYFPLYLIGNTFFPSMLRPNACVLHTFITMASQIPH